MSYIQSKRAPFRVLILLSVFSLSLFAMGAVGVALVRRTNAVFSDMVKTELPMLSLMREISSQASLTRRAFQTAVATTGSERLVALKSFDDASLVNDWNIIKLRGLINDETGSALLKILEHKRGEYRTSAEVLLNELRGSVSLAVEAHKNQVDDAYGEYIAAQDAVALYAERGAVEKSDKIVQQGGTLYAFLLFVAIWPALVALGFFAYATLSTLFAMWRANR